MRARTSCRIAALFSDQSSNGYAGVSARRGCGNLYAPALEETEITAKTLQKISFELIGKSVLLWRTYRDTDQCKGQKIHMATRMHQMIMDAIRFHPDIQRLAELEKVAEEVEQELAVARKIRRILSGTRGTEPYPSTSHPT